MPVEASRNPVAATERTGGGPDDAKTVGALVKALIVTDPAYDEIVGIVRELSPKSRTSARSFASIASSLRRFGITISMRMPVKRR